jgi:hypothetical protein
VKFQTQDIESLAGPEKTGEKLEKKDLLFCGGGSILGIQGGTKWRISAP